MICNCLGWPCPYLCGEVKWLSFSPSMSMPPVVPLTIVSLLAFLAGEGAGGGGALLQLPRIPSRTSRSAVSVQPRNDCIDTCACSDTALDLPSARRCTFDRTLQKRDHHQEQGRSPWVPRVRRRRKPSSAIHLNAGDGSKWLNPDSDDARMALRGEATCRDFGCVLPALDASDTA